MGFIEGGWPGALPKDTEFFARARTELKLRHAQLVAFGATRKAGVRVEDDPRCGRCSTRRRRSCAWWRSPTSGTSARPCGRRWRRTSRWWPTRSPSSSGHGRRVFLDCEHFFDGYAARPRLRRPGARGGVRGRRRGRGHVRHQRRHAADGRRPGRRRRPRPGERQARHPLPGRHRVRGRQLPRRRRGRASPTCRAPRTATASGPATPTPSR